MDITKFLNLIETALPYGKTNLTADELLSLGMTVLSGSAMQNLSDAGDLHGPGNGGDPDLIWILI